jgi:group II intron reverse transcriptase/maturase
MPETENNPVLVDKVRELQRKLYVCAKQSKTRRFHALYDRIHRSDVLWRAWMRVRSNRGAAGVDEVTLRSIEEQGEARFLEGIQADLKAGRYRPSPVRRQYIDKGDGKQRPLGIPTVRDRVVQMAAKIMIEPIFEADFEASSYGFRPKQSATEALEAIRIAGNQGHDFVVDADIKGYLDSIDQAKLMILVEERISDGRVLKLIRQWLRAGVMEDGTVRETLAGTPQGGVISPLLSNIYLHLLDRLWAKKCGWFGMLIRYADDFVVMCTTESKAKEALRQVHFEMSKLGLVLHPEKTRMVNLSGGKESFVFLGCTIGKKRSIQRHPRRYYTQRWPSPKAMKKVRKRVHELTDKRQSGKDVKQIIAKLNPVLRGWGNYFRTGNAERKFNQLDSYVNARLTRWKVRRGGQRSGRVEQWSHDRFVAMGLYRLRGTVKYPAQATQRRSSVSRVQENCTHGLKGVC